MTPHQAVCHLSDAFRIALREKPVADRTTTFTPVLRFVALRVPLKWPKGFQTVPEVEQGCGGTPPFEFERDRTELLSLMSRFSASGDHERAATHPIFGPMTTFHWGRWGYLHVDHHLRQFGV